VGGGSSEPPPFFVPVTTLSWPWIGLMVTLPPLMAIALAYPLWHRGQTMLGSIAGTVVVFGSALAFIGREYSVLDRITQACLDAGTTCWPEPPAFTRFAIYAFIALMEVFAMFGLGLRVEARRRNERYAPEWR
jgi:hypothetical protein